MQSSERVDHTLMGTGFPTVQRAEPSVVVTDEVGATESVEEQPLQARASAEQPTSFAPLRDPGKDAAETLLLEAPIRRTTWIFFAASTVAAFTVGLLYMVTQSPSPRDAVPVSRVARTAPEPQRTDVALGRLDSALETASTSSASARAQASIDGGSCELRIVSKPTGGTVMINGRVAGEAPITVHGVWCGRKTQVDVTRDGFATWTGRVVAEEGRQTEVMATLARPSAPTVIKSTPAGAEVWVDGELRGSTPTALFVTSSVRHVLELRLPGYETHRRTFAAQAEQRLTIDATLALDERPLVVVP